MPAPIDVMNAYAHAQADRRRASAMKEMGIDNTIKYWATATETAKAIVKGYLLTPHSA